VMLLMVAAFFGSGFFRSARRKTSFRQSKSTWPGEARHGERI